MRFTSLSQAFNPPCKTSFASRAWKIFSCKITPHENWYLDLGHPTRKDRHRSLSFLAPRRTSILYRQPLLRAVCPRRRCSAFRFSRRRDGDRQSSGTISKAGRKHSLASNKVAEAVRGLEFKRHSRS